MTKRIIISGASSGIGQCYARVLADREPCEFLLIARRKQRLEELAVELGKSKFPAKSEVCSGDLTDRSFLEKLAEKITSDEKPYDLLINNAGFGTVGRYCKQDTQHQLDMVKLNCLAPMELTNFVLPKMIAHQRGAIINVCSTASFQPMPFMATYGATKSFLQSWSLALASELRESGVRVLSQCPGPTATEFHIASGLPEKMSHLPAMTAKQVVIEALDALDRDRQIIVHGKINIFLANLNRLFSKKFSAKLVKQILQSDANKVDTAR
jgi:hypothetical protein